MLSDPDKHPHPLFPDYETYRLDRMILDTGDEITREEATATLIFRHRKTENEKRFRLSGVRFSGGYMSNYLSQFRSDYVYIAMTESRGWERGHEIEVGCTDPGHEWFWASRIEVIEST